MREKRIPPCKIIGDFVAGCILKIFHYLNIYTQTVRWAGSLKKNKKLSQYNTSKKLNGTKTDIKIHDTFWCV